VHRETINVNFPALDIPDNPNQLADWLEGHLLGLQLADLVAGFEAVHGDDVEHLSLEEVCGDQLPAILKSGLTVLKTEQLRQLLRNPRLLLDLQERILINGDVYWNSIPIIMNQELEEVSEKTWNQLIPQIGLDADTAKKPVVLQNLIPWYSRPSIVSLVTAATVLIAVWGWNQIVPPHPVPPVVVSWGWDRPGAIPADVDAATYLTNLADAANDWFKKRPNDSAALARRIAQFRQGCSTLILSDHKPLTKEDREWLIERCQGWASKLDTQLAAVEAGEDILKVRAAVDETISKLIQALRTRAGQVS